MRNSRPSRSDSNRSAIFPTAWPAQKRCLAQKGEKPDSNAFSETKTENRPRRGRSSARKVESCDVVKGFLPKKTGQDRAKKKHSRKKPPSKKVTPHPSIKKTKKQNNDHSAILETTANLYSIVPKSHCSNLEAMHLTRFMDDKMGKLVRQNKGGTFHFPSSGHEMIGAMSALSLHSRHRLGVSLLSRPGFCDRPRLLARRSSRRLFSARNSEPFGRADDARTFSQQDLRIPCQSSCVGSQFLQAVGTCQIGPASRRE